MAILAPLLAFAGRFIGKVLNMAFGWASTLLFGQVPQSKQLLLSGISLAAILWVATLVGVILPDLGTWLLAFVPRPSWIQEGWLRLAMLVLALILPLVIGIASIVMLEPGDRPKGMGKPWAVLRGYPYAAVLAIVLLTLIVVAPIRKVRSILKGWTDEHIPVVVRPEATSESPTISSRRSTARRSRSSEDERHSCWSCRRACWRPSADPACGGWSRTACSS